MARLKRFITCVGLIALSAAVAGCGFGAGDIELKGGVFDALGVSGAQNTKRRDDVKLKPRAPLVLPPGVERLPSPGTSTAAADPEMLTIQDPDEIKVVDKAALEKAQQEYCDKHYQELQHGNEFVKGPLGPCRKSVMTAIQKWNSGSN